MADVNDWGDSAVATQQKSQANDWGDLPTEQPKAPDTSGIVANAHQNLANATKPDAESEAKPETPLDRVETASGVPVRNILNGTAKPSEINTASRGEYVKALNNGSATNFGDWMQTVLHTVAPIAAGIVHPLTHADNIAKASGRIGNEELAGIKEGAEEGTIFPTSNLVGQFANLPFQVMGAGFSAYQRGIQQAGEEFNMPQVGKELALLPEEMMGSEGIHVHLPPAPKIVGGTEFPIGTGAWENHPGAEPIQAEVAKRSGKDHTEVSTPEINQTIAQGSQNLAPAGNDFKAVATVTGIPETSLQVVFKETGVPPEKVFTDAQQNPQIATDIAAGKVPDAYEHLVEPKSALPEKAAEKLSVTHDDATRSYQVVDKDGDHVSGGFDSSEEAQHFIEDEKFKAEERAAIEEEENPNVEQQKKDLSGALRKETGALYGDIHAVLNNKGETAGNIYSRTNENGDTQISLSSVIPDEGRKGYFSKAYRTMADNAIDEGRALASDTTITPLAEKLYEGMKRDGYTVEVNPKAKRTPSGNLSTYSDEPVFRVTEKPKATETPPNKTDDILKAFVEKQTAQAVKEADKYRGQTEPNWSTKEEVGLFDLPSEIKTNSPEHQAYADRVYDNRINSSQYKRTDIDNSEKSDVKTVKDYPNGQKLVSTFDGFKMLEPFKTKEYASGYKEDVADTIGTLQINKNTGVHNFSVNPKYRGTGIGQELLKAAESAGFDVKLAKDRSPAYVKAIKRFEESKSPATELDVAGKQGEQLAAANEGRLKPTAKQKAPDDGLFDVAGRGQGDIFDQKPKTTNVVPASEIGKPTSLRTFLSNNGAKFNEDNELISIKKDGERIKGDAALDYAHQISKDHGYFSADEANKVAEPRTELQNALTEKGGRESFREQDADRVAKQREAAQAKQWQDPAFIEKQAHDHGIDTDKLEGETDKQYTRRLLKALNDLYSEQGGAAPVGLLREAIGATIKAAEEFVGKLSGGLFDKLGEAYVKTFQPELMGDKALRADAFLAKYKARIQESENAFYRQFQSLIDSWEKKTSDQRMAWIYDHETGRWNEATDPDHAMFQTLLDSAFKEEKKSIGADADKGYKENYLPLQFADTEGVKKFFSSEAMIKKYGADWFTKARTFDLIQDAIRAGFKLRTDNPGRMLVSRLMAGQSMIRTMDLLHDMESSGVATKATLFLLDKRIAKTQMAIAELKDKYKKQIEDIQNPKQTAAEGIAPPPPSKVMQKVMARLGQLELRLNDFNKEKADNKLTPQEMRDLKNGFRVIGPDSKVWNIHQEVAPLWKNAMEMKGLYDRQGVTGDAYRAFTQIKNLWTEAKLSLSLFHPMHEVGINLAQAISAPIHHLIQGGKFSDLGWGDFKSALPIGDGRGIDAYNTKPEDRTPQQHEDVKRMAEGGFVPTMSARDAIHFRDNFDKAIAKVGTNNLRLIGTALQLPGKIFEPLFSKWIPRLRSESYFSLTDKALARDPTLANDAGRRGEVFRAISQDIDRTFGQLSSDTLFWDKNVKDAFNASFISGGWKLAQIYNARGLLQPANIAYKFAKTGEFSKADITYNMINAYAYTGVTLMMGAAINKILGNPIGKSYDEAKNLKDYMWSIVEDCLFPKTGEKNPDGTPIRLSQPAFAKEYFMLARDINTKGLISGTGSFVYHSTLLPSIANTLSNRDFVGREEISNPLDLHQWTNAGWDAINPITISSYEHAGEKGSDVGKVAGLAGFPIAGAYINQTAFEQKVLAKYEEQNPPKGDAYQAKLKTQLKAEIKDGDTKAINATKERMKEEGMSDADIAKAGKQYTKKFVDTAWKELSAQDQRRLIESATDEEKKNFPLKSH